MLRGVASPSGPPSLTSENANEQSTSNSNIGKSICFSRFVVETTFDTTNKNSVGANCNDNVSRDRFVDDNWCRRVLDSPSKATNIENVENNKQTKQRDERFQAKARGIETIARTRRGGAGDGGDKREREQCLDGVAERGRSLSIEARRVGQQAQRGERWCDVVDDDDGVDDIDDRQRRRVDDDGRSGQCGVVLSQEKVQRRQRKVGGRSFLVSNPNLSLSLSVGRFSAHALQLDADLSPDQYKTMYERVSDRKSASLRSSTKRAAAGYDDRPSKTTSCW